MQPTVPSLRTAATGVWPLTLAVDLALLAAWALAPWLWWLALPALGGAVVALSLVARLGRACRDGTVALPPLWLPAALLLPCTTAVALKRGAWAGSSPASRLRHRLGVTLLLVALAATTASHLGDRYVGSVGLGVVEQRAAAYLEGAVKKASLMLVTVAALNGSVSVLKSFDISVGVGISLGEVLDPIDDLVETLSWVMAASTASLVAQLLLLRMGSALGLAVLLPLGLMLLALVFWLPPSSLAARLARLSVKIVVAAVLVRVAVPVMALGGSLLSTSFIADDYEQSRLAMEGAQSELATESARLRAIEGALPKAASPGVGLWQTIKEAPTTLANLLADLNVSGRIAALKERLIDLADHVVRLIALLLLETILFPLVALWCLLRLFKLLSDAPQQVEVMEPPSLAVGLGLWPR